MADMDEAVASFSAITSAPPDRAAQYLQLSDGNLEAAVQLYFESPDLGLAPPAALELPPVPPASTRPTAARPSHFSEDEEGIVHIPSDDEDEDVDMGDTPEPSSHHAANTDADAEMARRLQEELYAGGSGGGGAFDPEGIRAPMARTTETLVGPGADWGSGPGDVEAAIQQQLRMRERARLGRPGIFNQRDTSAIWNEASASAAPPAAIRQRELSAATGGASDSSTKSNLLAELFRPPFDLMFHGSWDSARDKGKDELKWLLVNVQDSSVFDCQVLNRDIWKNEGVKETIKENFVFLQYNKDDPAGMEYIQYYFPAHESQDAYPHIAIVDPRTGEQVKIWSGRPMPQPTEFLMQLHEFLDRYSLNANARNPIAKRKPERKKHLDVERMTEEEMLEMAMQNSLENNGGPVPDDPDALTKSDILTRNKGKAPVEVDVDSGLATPDVAEPSTNGTAAASPFAQISSSNPHQEPANDPATTTRIQFRHPEGRVVRRFATSDTVRRLYEWLKAEPLPGKDGQDFELVAMGKNLIDSLDATVQDAGLKNGTVMVEFVGGADDE